jgi:hypothetical protein
MCRPSSVAGFALVKIQRSELRLSFADNYYQFFIGHLAWRLATGVPACSVAAGFDEHGRPLSRRRAFNRRSFIPHGRIVIKKTSPEAEIAACRAAVALFERRVASAGPFTTHILISLIVFQSPLSLRELFLIFLCSPQVPCKRSEPGDKLLIANAKNFPEFSERALI